MTTSRRITVRTTDDCIIQGHELDRIRHALRTAAPTFRSHHDIAVTQAAKLEQDDLIGRPRDVGQGHRRIAAEFARYAEECDALLDRLEDVQALFWQSDDES